MNNDKMLCDKLDINPGLINTLKENTSLSVIGKIRDLCVQNKYQISTITPDWILKRLCLDINFVKTKLNQDFKLIFLFKDYVSITSFFRDRELCDICLKNNYYLTVDSPEFLLNNFPLFLESLKVGSIKFEEANLEKYLNFEIYDLIKIIDIANFCEYSDQIIEEMKEKIMSYFFETVDNKLYISKLSPTFCEAINLLPADVNNIYFKHSFEIISKSFINKVTNAMKKSGKKINIVFRLPEDYIETEELKNINDKEAVFFESINGVNKFSAKDLLNLNNILDLFVKDIKGSNLSPYEKYIAVYNMVKGFKEYEFYLESEIKDAETSDQSRNIYLILLNNFIVCAGYAKLLTTLLKKVGIGSVYVINSEKNHALAYVNIEDSKYHINGYYKCDITGDATNDIINKGYYNIHEIISSSLFETDLDKKLLNPTEFPYFKVMDLDYKVYEKAMKLQREEELEFWKEHLKEKLNNPIPKKKLLEAIISVQEFIDNEKYDPEIRRKQKNLLCLNNSFFRDELDGFEEDLKLMEQEFDNMTLGKCLSYLDSNNYDAICTMNILNKKICDYHFNPRSGYAYGIRIEEGKLIVCGGVPEEKQEKVISYLEKIGIDNFDTVIKDGRFYFSFELINYAKDILVNEALSYAADILKNIDEFTINSEFSI